MLQDQNKGVVHQVEEIEESESDERVSTEEHVPVSSVVGKRLRSRANDSQGPKEQELFG